MASTPWIGQQLAAAQALVEQGNMALRQNQLSYADEALAEASVILDMAVVERAGGEDGRRVVELRAQMLNERGVIYQRGQQFERALDYQREAVALCDELLEDGGDFRGNAAATLLNLATTATALEQFEEASGANARALELVDALAEEGYGEEIAPLAFGAYSSMALMELRQELPAKADGYMEQAISIARELIEAGNQAFGVNAAQGSQQISVMFFHQDHHELALKWGKEAKELSAAAYETLGQDVLPIYVVSEINLISYYQELGQFADAEDCLWNAIEVLGHDARLLARGKDFYEHVRKQADKRLEVGNLPREEVEEGYQELNDIIESIGGLEALQQQLEELEGDDDNDD